MGPRSSGLRSTHFLVPSLNVKSRAAGPQTLALLIRRIMVIPIGVAGFSSGAGPPPPNPNLPATHPDAIAAIPLRISMPALAKNLPKHPPSEFPKQLRVLRKSHENEEG